MFSVFLAFDNIVFKSWLIFLLDILYSGFFFEDLLFFKVIKLR